MSPRGFRTKKFYRRLLLTIMVLLLLTITTVSVFSYYYTEQTVLKQQEEADGRTLNQINYNVYTMEGLVRTLAFQLQADNELLPLMLNAPIDNFNAVRYQRKLDSIVRSTSYLHSLMIYNGTSDKFYMGGYGVANERPVIESRVKQLLTSSEPPTKLQLIPISLLGDEDKIDAFSYLMFDSLDQYKPGVSAIILNVNAEWLFQNLENLNNLTISSETSSIHMLDEQNNLYPEPETSFVQLDEALVLAKEQMIRSEESSVTFTYKDEKNSKYLSSVLSTRVKGWSIVTMKAYEEIFRDINRIRIITISGTLVFFLLAAIITILLARRLYRPIEDITRYFRTSAPIEETGSLVSDYDELSYITKVHEKVVEKLKVVKQKQLSKRDVVKQYFLRRWILESYLLKEPVFKEEAQDSQITIDVNGGFKLVYLQIDYYAELVDRVSTNELSLYSFAVANIVEESIKQEFKCELVDLKRNQLVAMVEWNECESDERLTTLLSEAQLVISSYYSITVSVTISESISDYASVTSIYGQVLQNAVYRLVYGPQAMITSEKIKAQVKSAEPSLSTEIENKLAGALKLNHLEEALAVLDDIFATIRGFHVDQMLPSIFQIVNLLKNTIRELNSNRLITISADLNQVNHMILNKETLNDMQLELAELIRSIVSKQQGEDEQRNDVLMEAIKEMIEEQYADQNLSLQSISTSLKMSAKYIGRIFKQSEMVSVADYVNDIRLSHAASLLENEEYSVNEIMEKIGYGNQSYFFRIFKKKFGATPREYRLKRSLEEQ
jgi:YesN/AraC family two-component response regulator